VKESVHAAFNQLQNSVKEQLTLEMDGSGAVSYKINRDKSGKEVLLSSDAQQLMNAIDNHTINIEVGASLFAKHTSKGNLMVGGAFMGNTVTNKMAKDPSGKTVNIVDAKQEINPAILESIDDVYQKPGQSTLHEVTEAYQGAKIAQRSGVSIPMAIGDGTLEYAIAHKLAAPQAGPITQVRLDKYGTPTSGLIPSVTRSAEWYVQTPKSGKVRIMKYP